MTDEKVIEMTRNKAVEMTLGFVFFSPYRREKKAHRIKILYQKTAQLSTIIHKTVVSCSRFKRELGKKKPRRIVGGAARSICFAGFYVLVSTQTSSTAWEPAAVKRPDQIPTHPILGKGKAIGRDHGGSMGSRGMVQSGRTCTVG